jgi:hypothetical protein
MFFNKTWPKVIDDGESESAVNFYVLSITIASIFLKNNRRLFELKNGIYWVCITNVSMVTSNKIC